MLGSALWEVDWMLYAMTLSITRVHMNQCTGCNFASWWPVSLSNPDRRAGVKAQYFGLALVADWLGLGSPRSGAPLRVASLFDAQRRNVSPYAGYVSGALDRYVVLGLNVHNATETGPRVTRTFALDVPGSVRAAELRRLTGTGTDVQATDMTYAGLPYSMDYPSGQVIGPATETVQIQNGKATFQLAALEAVLLLLH